ncbi:hypothetical protein ABEI33_09110 [Pantoea agglomerans]|uniref:hypothetical protein n=1 Tax=Enterobacter agglomerans TaxID=549 RepID=UPI00165487EE|nr:hypothetical protein [Pantoea agglomerans]
MVNKKIITFSILLIFTILGCMISYHKAPYAFGSGDHNLFHAFGHWIANGEVFTKDFIHFRTPGPYYYYGIMQYIFGETFLTTSTSLLMESHVFQMFASFALALALTKNFFGKSSLFIATATALFFLAAPPIYQLRTALPAAALALYLLSYSNLSDDNKDSKNPQLIISGLLLGISFWFGQELFIFLSISIFAGEFSSGNKFSFKNKIIRILKFGLAALFVIIAGIVYLYLKGVNIHEFLYNTLYYAFFIQPSGMDVPFPSFDKSSLIYYVWIAFFIVSFIILGLSQKLFTPTGVAFSAYASLRLISMFGRADLLHLLFSISELLIMGIVSLRLLRTCFKNINLKTLISTFIISAITIISLYFAIHGKSSALLVMPLALLAVSYLNNTTDELLIEKEGSNAVYAVTGLGIALLALYPMSISTIKLSYYSFFIKPKSEFLGVQLPPDTQKQFLQVKGIIDSQKPESIFSYPIRAEYYALTKKHGTRFIEFAMQTTPDDINNAISDLKENKPQLVIQDLDQTINLSPILNKLSNFIAMNYTPITTIQGVNNLEIYKLKESSGNKIRLFDNIYTYNDDHTHTTGGLRTTENGNITPVIATNTGNSRFIFDENVQSVIIQIYPEPNASASGIIEVIKGTHSVKQVVKLSDGRVKIDLPEGNEKAEILLSSGEMGKSVLWLNPQAELSPQT